MTQIRVYGNPHSGALDTSCTTVSPTPPTAIAPIQVRRWVRNGKAPDSTLINRVREAANFAALYRSKQTWGGIGFDGGNAPLGGASGGTIVCHRAACHSGPYTHAFYIKGVVYPPLSSATQAKVTVSVYSDAAMSTLVGSADLLYGPKPSGISFGWRMARVMSAWLDGVSPDADYYISISATDSCKLGGLAIYDMQSLSETTAGYLGVNLTMHSPVVYSDRQQPHTILKNIWKRGGAQVLNWSSAGRSGGLRNIDTSGTVTSGQYVTSTSTTLTNLIDRTSTTVSANTPGYTVDLTYKDRISQTSGVPCVMKVWGYSAGFAGVSGDGTVVLKNSAGTTVASIASGFTLTPGWLSVVFNLPATSAKYDLQFKTNNASARFLVGAVSIYELE